MSTAIPSRRRPRAMAPARRRSSSAIRIRIFAEHDGSAQWRLKTCLEAGVSGPRTTRSRGVPRRSSLAHRSLCPPDGAKPRITLTVLPDRFPPLGAAAAGTWSSERLGRRLPSDKERVMPDEETPHRPRRRPVLLAMLVAAALLLALARVGAARSGGAAPPPPR